VTVSAWLVALPETLREIELNVCTNYSINTPTNALIEKLHIKTRKLLRHVSVQRPSSRSYIFLAQVTLKIVND